MWKRPGGVMTEQHVKGTVKFGGGSLMMWGCMTAQGVGYAYACRIDGRMDSELYTNTYVNAIYTLLCYSGYLTVKTYSTDVELIVPNKLWGDKGPTYYSKQRSC